jgi:hypothetical protein
MDWNVKTSQAAKNHLEGKTCNTCPNNIDNVCRFASNNRPLPKKKTCKNWGLWTMIYMGGNKIL